MNIMSFNDEIKLIFNAPNGVVTELCGPDPVRLLREANRIAREQIVFQGCDVDVKARFLAAWKAGVLYIGEEYFDILSDVVVSAGDKNQLRPRANAELLAAGASSGEKVMLGAMLSFFNEVRGEKYLNQIGCLNPCDVSGRLDFVGRNIIAAMTVNYTGW